MRRRRKQKGRKGKIFLLLILIGIGTSMLLLFQQDILNLLKPWLEKRGLLREKKEVVLYFSDGEGEYLIGEKREILKREEVEEEAGEAVAELAKGPKGKLISTLPAGTKLLALQLDEKGVAKVNFNRAFLEGHPGGSSAEVITVYSIVNSLTLNFPEIKQVQFLVEGRKIETVAGHLSLGKAVPSKPDLIKKSFKN